MYGIWERIRKRFPKLILENCAGGGKRTDLGMLSRFHFTWFSDHVLAPRTLRMQNGLMLALPPERLARLTGVVMNGHLGGDLDMQLRMNFLLGNPCISGIWPTQEDKNPLVYQRIQHMVALFKKHVRPLIRSCKVYHHTPVINGLYPEGWCVFEYAAPDQSKSIAGVFRLAGGDEVFYKLKFKGLSRSKMYTVYLDNKEESFVASGRNLIETGIDILLESPMSSELVIVAQN
jgi:alpha-galactosidase